MITDAERELVSAELRAHFTSGRLGMEEFTERLESAWSANSLDDLMLAVRDLPPVPGNPRPWDAPATVPAVSQAPWTPCRRRPRRAGPSVYRFLKVSLILTIIWALTGFGYFWPIWPMAIWGFLVLRRIWRSREGWAETRWT